MQILVSRKKVNLQTYKMGFLFAKRCKLEILAILTNLQLLDHEILDEKK